MEDQVRRIVRIEVETLPDKDGKQRFCAMWRNAQRERRSQYFNTNLDQHVQSWKGQGYTVDVEYLPGVKP